MRVILNADDFGFSDDTVEATIASFEQGALTSATIMPAMPATERALDYARRHPEFSFGAHLTFTGDGVERPLSDPREIPTLVNAEGRFLDTRTVMLRAFVRRLPLREIAVEASAQLARLRDAGLSISHVDSHGHPHKFAAFMAALREVLPRFGVTRMRRGQNVWIKRPLQSPTYWVGGAWHPPVGRWFRTTDRFFMPTCRSDAERAPEVLERVRHGTLEIGVHPGTNEAWRRLESDTAARLASAVRAKGGTLMTWKDL